MRSLSHLPLEELQDSLNRAGFDIFKPFPTSLYNATRPASCPKLQTYGRTHAVSVIVGNSGHLWPRFLASLRSRPQDPLLSDPLDRYTEETASDILRRADTPVLPAASISFVHTRPGRPHFVDAIHAAEVSGLAFKSPVAFLALHPEFGPWFALRMVLSFDADLQIPVPLRLADPIPEAKLARLLSIKDQLDLTTFGSNWKSWLAFRDAVGEALGAQSHRYPEDMITYHYAGDASVLLPDAASQIIVSNQ